MAVNQLGDGSTDGVVISPAGSKAAFYGVAPVAQRAANTSLHQTSWLSASSNITVGSNLSAFALEVANTLVGLGLWV